MQVSFLHCYKQNLKICSLLSEVVKPEDNQFRGLYHLSLLIKKTQRRLSDYNCAFINIRGQQSKKVVGKNPTSTLP